MVDGARTESPSSFTPNGWTVTALQAAASAIAHTPEREDQFVCGIHAAIRIGNDTDTVAAIAGALLGARWGTRAIPIEWQELIHGWPELTGAGIVDLARRVANDDGHG